MLKDRGLRGEDFIVSDRWQKLEEKHRPHFSGRILAALSSVSAASSA